MPNAHRTHPNTPFIIFLNSLKILSRNLIKCALKFSCRLIAKNFQPMPSLTIKFLADKITPEEGGFYYEEKNFCGVNGRGRLLDDANRRRGYADGSC
ncbi:MAG: hypothetical protein IJT06_04485 [Selenomonadaceae bacterium]|nr:hypothetical protein [Selenomonadaceae bacterium]